MTKYFLSGYYCYNNFQQSNVEISRVINLQTTISWYFIRINNRTCSVIIINLNSYILYQLCISTIFCDNFHSQYILYINKCICWKTTSESAFVMHQLIVLSAIIGVCFSAPPELKDARVPTLDGRIVGGDPVFIEDYRYTASLLYSASHRCGAVIISETILITAAHCTDG